MRNCERKKYRYDKKIDIYIYCGNNYCHVISERVTYNDPDIDTADTIFYLVCYLVLQIIK